MYSICRKKNAMTFLSVFSIEPSTRIKTIVDPRDDQDDKLYTCITIKNVSLTKKKIHQNRDCIVTIHVNDCFHSTKWLNVSVT